MATTETAARKATDMVKPKVVVDWYRRYTFRVEVLDADTERPIAGLAPYDPVNQSHAKKLEKELRSGMAMILRANEKLGESEDVDQDRFTKFFEEVLQGVREKIGHLRTARETTNQNGAGSQGSVDRQVQETELGIAHRFVEEHRDKICFNPGLGWLAWADVVWKTGNEADPEIHKMMEEFARSLHAEAAALHPSSGEHDRLRAIANKISSARGIRAILDLASRDKVIRVKVDDLDANPLLLNCPNGIADLRHGELLPHDSKLLMTQITGCEYLEDAKSELWEETLFQIFAGENQRDLLGFVHRLAGYSATGLSSEELLVLLYGSGRNGKGTMTELLMAALGSYAKVAPMSLFLSKRGGNDSNRFDLATMRGARLVTASEAAPGSSFNIDAVKSFTGGDRRTCEHKYKDRFEYPPRDTLWLSVNDKPAITGWDIAIRDRVHLIGFPNSFTKEQGNQDQDLKQRLQESRELQGVLNWIVSGAVIYNEVGLNTPNCVRVAVTEYERESQRVDEFMDLHYRKVSQGTGTVPQADAYAKYRDWARGQGFKPSPANKFGAALGKAGWDTKKMNLGKVILGCAQLSHAESREWD